MARQPRDYRAEYRRRIEKGRREGLTRAQARGHSRTWMGEESIAQLRRRGVFRPVPRGAGSRAVPAVVEVGDTRIATTRNTGDIRRELKRAAARGDKVTLRITADAGQGPRSHTYTGQAGQAAFIASRVDAAGGGTLSPSAGTAEVELTSKVSLTSGPAATGGDPADLLDFLDTYDDPDDALADIWAEFDS